jgi:hypothetical protein
MLRRRVAPRRLSLTKACVSSVGAGAPLGRDAIQRSASSSTGDRSNNPPVRPPACQRRAASPYSVCFLIQAISVCNASHSRSKLAANNASSSKKMKFSRASAVGISLSSTGAMTIGAKRLLSEAANATSLAHTSEATEAGLSTKMMVSAPTMRDWMRPHQSSNA